MQVPISLVQACHPAHVGSQAMCMQPHHPGSWYSTDQPVPYAHRVQAIATACPGGVFPNFPTGPDTPQAPLSCPIMTLPLPATPHPIHSTFHAA